MGLVVADNVGGFQTVCGRGWSHCCRRRQRTRWVVTGRVFGTAMAMAGALGKASLGGELSGPNPTDRAKRRVKQSLLTEGKGVPFGITPVGANLNDFKFGRATIESIPIERSNPPRNHRPQGLCPRSRLRVRRGARPPRRVRLHRALPRPRRGSTGDQTQGRLPRAGSSNAPTPAHRRILTRRRTRRPTSHCSTSLRPDHLASDQLEPLSEGLNSRAVA